MLCTCEVTNSIMHLKDATKTKTGYLSKRGKYCIYSARHRYLWSKRFKYFFLYLFPYILALIFLIFGLIQLIDAKIVLLNEYVSLGLMLAIVTIFAVSTISFLHNKELIMDVGSPERTIVEVSGSINIETGAVSASGRAYDTYSSTQWVMMILNIIYFIVGIIVFAASSWIIYLIYVIRRITFKKLASKEFASFDAMSPFERTMYCACDEELKQEPEDTYLLDEDGTRIEESFVLWTCFYYGESIYAIFHLEEDEKQLVIYEVLEGYKPRFITNHQEFVNILDLYDKLQAEQ